MRQAQQEEKRKVLFSLYSGYILDPLVDLKSLISCDQFGSSIACYYWMSISIYAT